MKVPLSKQFLEWLGVAEDRDAEMRKEFNERLKHIIKPCWELKFCPYGPLVEDFPLPPILLEEHKKHSEFEKEASCQEFGHLCPAYFASGSSTETREVRNRRRNLPHATIVRVVRRDNNTCQNCGKILLDKEIEIDHIIPYSRGGSSDESNLRVTCLECNRKKGKKIEL